MQREIKKIKSEREIKRNSRNKIEVVVFVSGHLFRWRQINLFSNFFPPIHYHYRREVILKAYVIRNNVGENINTTPNNRLL